MPGGDKAERQDSQDEEAGLLKRRTSTAPKEGRVGKASGRRERPLYTGLARGKRVSRNLTEGVRNFRGGKS